MLRKYIRKIISEGPGVTRSMAKQSSRYKKIAPGVSSQNFQKLANLADDNIEQALALGDTLDQNYEKVFFLDNEKIEKILIDRLKNLGLVHYENNTSTFQNPRRFKKGEIRFYVDFDSDFFTNISVVMHCRGWKANFNFDLINFKNKALGGTHGVGYSNPDNWRMRPIIHQQIVTFYKDYYDKNNNLRSWWKNIPKEEYDIESAMMKAIGQSDPFEEYELTLDNIFMMCQQFLEATKKMATQIEHIK